MTEILNKDDFIIIKNEKNKYSATINICEGKIDVMRLFQFDKLHILKQLNADIIEKLEITHSSNEDYATILILYKHFFRELGFSQFGICLDVIRVERENLIEFVSSNNSSIKHDNSDYVILPIDTLFMKIFQGNNGFCKITLDTVINVSFEISPAIEKLVLQLVHKIFTRVKQFIEN
jgi:hypothetical protein